MHDISLEVDGSGTTDPATGNYQYNEGDVVNITAIPDEGWQFDSWNGGVTNAQSNATTIIISSNETVTAKFSPIVHDISLEVDGGGSTKPAAGNHQYHEGDVVTIMAITDEGWKFDGWSGGVADPRAAVTTITVNSDKNVTAKFSPIVHDISLEVDGSGTTDPATGNYQYNEGDVVNITAIPDEGWQFDSWNGGVTNAQSNATTIIISSNETVTAKFSPIVHDISLEVDGGGSTKPAAGNHQYHEGDVVTIMAITDEGWKFDGWSGDVADPRAAVTTITVNSDKNVKANFSQIVPGWWQALRTLYDEVLAKLRSLFS